MDDQTKVDRHVAACPGCREEQRKYRSVISACRTLGRSEYQLPAGVRRRIAADAAERAARRRWIPWLPVQAVHLRPGVLAAVTACLVALLALPVMKRDLKPPAAVGDVSPRIEVVADGGVVRLAWSDGTRQSYTVFKSADPRDVRLGEAHVVRGNIWVDSEPESSQVVFYRIE